MLSIDMQFMLDEEKRTSILDMVLKRSGTMADTVVAKCVGNMWLNAFFPILILSDAHILSFYE